MVIKKIKKVKSSPVLEKKERVKKPTIVKKENAVKSRQPTKIKKEKQVEKKIISKPKVKTAAVAQNPTQTVEIAKKEIITEKIIRPQEKIKILKIQPKLKTEEKYQIPQQEIKEIKVKKEIEINIPITVKDLSIKLQEKSSTLIKKLMEMGMMVSLNNPLDKAIISKLEEAFDFKAKELPTQEEAIVQEHKKQDDPSSLKLRHPVVTLMGHVDHGKTSLLDAIKKSDIAAKEYGGITQHIGAYEVITPRGKITFLDTPGHEAFTEMRARGAKATDLVVLVVAADDGVMPQTIEAIDHARIAGVPILVALNKIDKPGADADKVKKQLAGLNLLSEDWGGKTIVVGVSAKTGQGIEGLLEMIILESEMLELKANFDRKASGVVIESKISKGRGPVSTFLVQNGTLHVNDIVLVGRYYGKIRAMFDEHSKQKMTALPSDPIEVLGLSGTPQSGEEFYVVDDEKSAREISIKRQELEKLKEIASMKKITLEEISSQIKDGIKISELNIILKADVQGSLEAAVQALNKLPNQEVKLNIIHSAVGLINTSDVILASACNAFIFGFHVEADEPAKEKANTEGVQIRTYNVIYELINELTSALEGLLKPKLKKIFTGRVLIKQVFKLSRSGVIAGCFVQKGKVLRSCDVSLVRSEQVIFEGKISSLKRFKDDVKEVSESMECGISLGGFVDIREGDIIEAYQTEKIARKLV